MNDALDCCNNTKMTMEAAEGSKAPASRPQEDVIATREHPENWKVGVTQNSRAIGAIAPDLFTSCIACMS